MQVDLSMKEWASLVAAVTERHGKCRREANVAREVGDKEWAKQWDAEADMLESLKERIWNA